MLYSHPHYPLDRKLGVPQSWSGNGGEEKHLCPYWELNPDSLVIQPIA
jgi:hypothetical protein